LARWSQSSSGGDRRGSTRSRVRKQLSAVLDLQRTAGRTTFLVAATTETSEELAAVAEAIGVDRIATVLLTAPAEVVAARIAAREPDIWPAKQGLIALARQLAISMPQLAGIDFRVDTDGRDPADVAVDVLTAMRDFDMLA
jgi:hypothetical protein